MMILVRLKMKAEAVILIFILFQFGQAQDSALPDIPESFSANIQVNILLTERSNDDFKVGKTVAFSEAVINPDKARLEYKIGKLNSTLRF